MNLRKILLISIILFILAIHPIDSLLTDEACYILLSREFAAGGFAQVVFAERLAHIHYYFLLPLLISPFNFITHGGMALMRIVPLISAGISVALFFLLVREWTDESAARILTLVFVVNPWTVTYAGAILTEMPYIALSLGALYCALLSRRRGSPGYFYLSAFCAGLSVYARPPGLALAAALLLWLLYRKQWRQTLWSTAIILVMLIPFILQAGNLIPRITRGIVLPQDFFNAQYQAVTPVGLVFRLGYNALVYAGSYLADLFFKPLAEPVAPRLGDGTFNPVFVFKFFSSLGLSLLIFRGFRDSKRQQGWQWYHFYCLGYIPLLLLSSVYVARYLFVILPFLVFFLHCGLRTCRRKFRVALWVMVISVSLCGSAQRIVEARCGYLPAAVKSFVACNDWVKSNTPQGARILSRKGDFTALYTGRWSVSYRITDDPAWQLDFIRQQEIDYLIVGEIGVFPGGHRVFERLIAEYPHYFTLEFATKEEPRHYVWKVHHL